MLRHTDDHIPREHTRAIIVLLGVLSLAAVAVIGGAAMTIRALLF